MFSAFILIPVDDTPILQFDSFNSTWFRRVNFCRFHFCIPHPLDASVI